MLQTCCGHLEGIIDAEHSEKQKMLSYLITGHLVFASIIFEYLIFACVVCYSDVNTQRSRLSSSDPGARALDEHLCGDAELAVDEEEGVAQELRQGWG